MLTASKSEQVVLVPHQHLDCMLKLNAGISVVDYLDDLRHTVEGCDFLSDPSTHKCELVTDRILSTFANNRTAEDLRQDLMSTLLVANPIAFPESVANAPSLL